MFNTIGAFTVQTFREAIRNKLLYGIGFFAVAILLFTLVLGELSLYEQERVIRDVGLTFITIMGVALAIFTGVSMIHKEIDRRIIYTILSKPIRRSEVIFGRFSGIALTLLVELLSMFLVFLLILVIRGMSIDVLLWQSFLLVYVKSLVIAASALMFATFSSAILSTLLSLALFILGSLYDQFSFFADKSDTVANSAFLRASQFILPNFSNTDISTQVSYKLDVAWSHVGLTSLSCLAYTIVLLVIASIIFERRDFI